MLAHSESAGRARQLFEELGAAQVALVHRYGLLPQQSALLKLLVLSCISIPNGNSFSRLLYPFLLFRHVVPPMALEKVGEALVQSQVRFNRVPKKVWCRARSGSIGFRRRPEKVWEALVQSQLRKVPEKSGRLWCRAR